MLLISNSLRGYTNDVILLKPVAVTSLLTNENLCFNKNDVTRGFFYISQCKNTTPLPNVSTKYYCPMTSRTR